MADVDITVGADTSAAQAGLASLRNAAASVGGELRGMFAGTFAIAGIAAAIKQTLDFGDKVYELGQRFGVSTTLIQQFGNVAERTGSSMESMTMALSRATLARSKALAGDNEQIAAWSRLNVSLADLRDENIDLAAIIRKTGTSSLDAAAGVKIYGRNFLEVRESIRALADDATELGHVIDPVQIEALHKATDTWKQFQEILMVVKASAVMPLVDAFNSVTAAIKNFNVETAKAVAIDYGKLLLKPFVVVPETIASLFGKSLLPSTAKPATPPPSPSPEEGVGGAAGGDKAGSTRISNAEKLGQIERANALKALDDEGKLIELDSRRASLQNRLSASQEGHIAFVEDEEALKIEIAKIDGQRLDLQNKITKSTQEWLDATEKATAEERENLLEMQLRAAGEDEIADFMREQFDFQTKINAAYADGNTELAGILSQEKAISAEMETQRRLKDINARQTEANARGAALVHMPGVAGLSELNVAGMVAGGISMGGTAFGLALAAGDPGSPEFEKAFAMLSAREQVANLQGKGGSVWGFLDRARAQHLSADYAKRVNATTSAEAEQSTLQQIDYWSDIARGGSGPAGNPYTSMYGGGTPMPSGSGASATQIGQLQTMLGLMQTAVGQLQGINQRLTPFPGGI